MRPLLISLLLPTFALTLTLGCARYELGRAGELPFRSVYVEPVQNESLAPQAQALLTTHLVEALNRDNRASVTAAPDNADATLSVVMKEYSRRGLTRAREDTGRADKFSLVLRVEGTLTDNRTGKDYFRNRSFTAERDAFVDGGLTQPEHQAMPQLTETLAHRISNLVLQTW